MTAINPGLILIIGALLVPVLPFRLRQIYMLALPVLAAAYLTQLDHGVYGQIEFFGLTLETMRLDKLSFIFGLIFHLAAFLGVLFALHVKDVMQQVSALMYAGAGIAAAFAGDLVTLFVFWELTAITSVFLIWARRTERAMTVGIRYLIIQVGSGVLLLAGLVAHYHATGSIAFDSFGVKTLDDLTMGSALILLAFGIKCAFPFLHNWLQDAYPEATATGTVILSAFTTKLAVYSLARGYAGFEPLIYIGAAMTAFPVFFAVIENDLRKVLAYSLNNQLGFMVVGVGVGSALALNGAASHAFAHILYKALLFMGMGAVLYRVGTTKATELGGLYKSMPYTTIFTIIGAMSISAFPLFSGFVTKSMILTAVAQEHHVIVWGILVFASAGVLEHSGIKIPFFAFFAHDSGKRPKEAPWNMLLAMGITAALCIGIGVYPDALYQILPFDAGYHPYTADHVVSQMQLLMFAVLAFIVLMVTGLYPPEVRSINLDFDWIYRRLLPAMWHEIAEGVREVNTNARALIGGGIGKSIERLYHSHGPQGMMARRWQTGTMVLWVAIMLGVMMIFYFI